jgi:hypothetical protein
MTSAALLRHVDEALFELADYLHAVESGDIEPLRDQELTRDALNVLAAYRKGFFDAVECEIGGAAPPVRRGHKSARLRYGRNKQRETCAEKRQS